MTDRPYNETITVEEAIRRIDALPNVDEENEHFEADGALVACLRGLGGKYAELAEKFEAVGKWYA